MTPRKRQIARAAPEDWRRARERIGLSNYAFARVIGVHLRTAQRYEAGDTPIPPPIALLLRYIERYGAVAVPRPTQKGEDT